MRVWYCFCDDDCTYVPIATCACYMSVVTISDVITTIVITKYRSDGVGRCSTTEVASRKYFKELTFNQCTDVIRTILPIRVGHLAVYESTVHRLLSFAPCDNDDRKMMLRNLTLMIRHRCRCEAAISASVRNEYNRFSDETIPYKKMIQFIIDKIQEGDHHIRR